MSRQDWKRVWAATVAGVIIAAAVAFAEDPQRFRIRDECDPATFNSGPPTGPGLGVICEPSFDGDETFTEFIDEITDTQKARHWRFQPESTHLDRGGRTSIQSIGGETHTFTRVADFGGGVVPLLNELSGAGATRAECLTPPSAINVTVPAGAHLTGPIAGSSALPKGTTKWQCCIHPWMRSTIEVR
jgi:hypothetical protein